MIHNNIQLQANHALPFFNKILPQYTHKMSSFYSSDVMLQKNKLNNELVF